MQISPWIGIGITVVMLIFTAGVSWGVTSAALKYKSNKILDLGVRIEKIFQDLSRIEEKLKSYLFVDSGPEKGTTIYMLRKNCEQQTELCQNRICMEFGEVKRMIKDGDSKRDDARNEFNSYVKEMSELVGRFSKAIEILERGGH